MGKHKLNLQSVNLNNQATNGGNIDKYKHVKRDLLKSALLSLLAIVVIVVVYWFQVKH